ncbi:hypothetical protein [Pedobacter quisquiliarum]|uniref:hypothetical protein n=1 Tax=Pedobacter quisquiliarum TaxID=1834438 RepID=UPI001663BAAA|nr:hypothetical protein [Pedobacter quisquiliarum]
MVVSLVASLVIRLRLNDRKLKKVREQLRIKRTPNAQQTHTERTRDPRKCAFAVRFIFVSCVFLLVLPENDSKIAPRVAENEHHKRMPLFNFMNIIDKLRKA